MLDTQVQLELSNTTGSTGPRPLFVIECLEAAKGRELVVVRVAVLSMTQMAVFGLKCC